MKKYRITLIQREVYVYKVCACNEEEAFEQAVVMNNEDMYGLSELVDYDIEEIE